MGMVRLAVGHVDKAGNAAAQIATVMHVHLGFGEAEMRRTKRRKP